MKSAAGDQGTQSGEPFIGISAIGNRSKAAKHKQGIKTEIVDESPIPVFVARLPFELKDEPTPTDSAIAESRSGNQDSYMRTKKLQVAGVSPFIFHPKPRA
jgi:hypothetical protein